MNEELNLAFSGCLISLIGLISTIIPNKQKAARISRAAFCLLLSLPFFFVQKRVGPLSVLSAFLGRRVSLNDVSLLLTIYIPASR